MPSWAAVIIAVIATAIGFAFDAGSSTKQLTHVFAGLYLTGCIAAVLAVRQSGVFTAVIQPPLILFFSVPGAYWLFHGGKVAGTKDILINCGYPLIERFPLMLFTSIAVLLIGVVRWYFGTTRRVARTARPDDADAAVHRPSIAAKLIAIVRRYWAEASGDDLDDETADPEPAKPTKPRRTTGSRSGKRADSARSRRTRRSLDDESASSAEPPRRRRPSPTRDFEDGPSPQRRRRSRPAADPDVRRQPPREAREPREPRQDPQLRRDRHEWSSVRSSRFDPYEPLEPYPYQAYEPYEPQRRRSPAAGINGPTHQPISRARYHQARYDESPTSSRFDQRSRRRPPERD